MEERLGVGIDRIIIVGVPLVGRIVGLADAVIAIGAGLIVEGIDLAIIDVPRRTGEAKATDASDCRVDVGDGVLAVDHRNRECARIVQKCVRHTRTGAKLGDGNGAPTAQGGQPIGSPSHIR